MIRPADEKDVGALVEMGRAFFEESGLPGTFNEQDFAGTLRWLTGGDVSGGVMVAEVAGETVGMLGYVLFPLYCNFATTIGQEVFWYVHPGYRTGIGGELLIAAEQEARAAGASVFLMAALAGLRDVAIARVYEQRGYRPAENTFLKGL